MKHIKAFLLILRHPIQSLSLALFFWALGRSDSGDFGGETSPPAAIKQTTEEERTLHEMLMESLEQAVAYENGEDVPGVRVRERRLEDVSEQEKALYLASRHSAWAAGAFDFARWLETCGFELGVGWYDMLEGFFGFTDGEHGDKYSVADFTPEEAKAIVYKAMFREMIAHGTEDWAVIAEQSRSLRHDGQDKAEQ